MILLDLSKLIQEITGRQESLFRDDLYNATDKLAEGIEGTSVLVIGGAGTIGSQFIKALLPYRPARLYVADISENGLTELVRDLRSMPGLYIPEAFRTYPVSYSSPVFRKILQKEGPFDTVANFAAHKHVRSEKDAYSAEAMLRNNVLEAIGLMDMLTEQPPGRFFCLSTDKAADPVNIMGASKKLMEGVALSYAGRFHVASARFSNVLFSTGSLPAGVMERLSKGQPLAAPQDIRRYFISPEESGQLCLLACFLSRNRDIFYPVMDRRKDMVTFTAIAERLLARVHYTPDYCRTDVEAIEKARGRSADDPHYPVYFFPSNTTGEKPEEVFYSANEMRDEGRFASLGVIRDSQADSVDTGRLQSELENLFSGNDYDKKDIVYLLSQYIPGFDHQDKGRHLDESI
ncbi:MAG: polysaccharide biosynthesis protein [Cyclobacteriaceae bacterium]